MLPLNGFFVEQWLDAYAARFRAEMPSQSISAGKTTATTPLAALFEISFANELLLSGMKSFVAFSVMLTSESFPTDCTYEWAFVGMGAEVRAEVVGTSKAFWTQITLEGCGVLLDPLRVAAI
jgi:hypothetical protein